MLSLSWYRVDVPKSSSFVSDGIFDEFLDVNNSCVLQLVCAITIGLR